MIMIENDPTTNEGVGSKGEKIDWGKSVGKDGTGETKKGRNAENGRREEEEITNELNRKIKSIS